MSCYYIGDTKPAHREEAEERGDIIFATYGMANEGLDIKHLNTVILACPKKDVVQSIGRIMRTILSSGSIRPMIVDIGDDVQGLNNWIDVRNNVYTKCKHVVENYYLIDYDYKTSFEYDNIDVDICADQLHHPDTQIHNMINRYNKDMISFKKDSKLFRSIVSDIDRLIKGKPSEPETINHVIENKEYLYSVIENKEYQVLDDMYTDLSDIMFVEKIKSKGF